ncbi:MAG: lytic transglycosylase domain-containing protein [Firmicutes bacterium]|nr:lytic transglycosylase domain-containing protein [Bacillota bacterium]
MARRSLVGCLRIPRRWLFLGATALAVAVLAWLSRTYILHQLYPFRFRDEIVTYARQNGLDPLFVAAVIKNESRFNPSAVSRRGAVGLMQIMPETGRWVASQLGFADFETDMLRDPATNIMIGTWYLAELKREFGGKFVLVVAAYNAGRGNVKQWVKRSGTVIAPSPDGEQGVWPGPDVSLDFPLSEIRINETRIYVRDVLSSLRRYRELYADTLE